jgi:hypothetical protein
MLLRLVGGNETTNLILGAGMGVGGRVEGGGLGRGVFPRWLGWLFRAAPSFAGQLKGGCSANEGNSRTAKKKEKKEKKKKRIFMLFNIN